MTVVIDFRTISCKIVSSYSFSMLPLLIKDGLLLAYVATTTALAFVLFALYGSNLNNLTKKLLVCLMM